MDRTTNAGEPEHDPELSSALEEALEGEPRAAELLHMCKLLVLRRAGLAADLAGDINDAERARLRREMARLDEQIGVLREEANITQFVEDAVRVGVEMRKLS